MILNVSTRSFTLAVEMLNLNWAIFLLSISRHYRLIELILIVVRPKQLCLHGLSLKLPDHEFINKPYIKLISKVNLKVFVTLCDAFFKICNFIVWIIDRSVNLNG